MDPTILDLSIDTEKCDNLIKDWSKFRLGFDQTLVERAFAIDTEILNDLEEDKILRDSLEIKCQQMQDAWEKSLDEKNRLNTYKSDLDQRIVSLKNEMDKLKEQRQELTVTIENR